MLKSPEFVAEQNPQISINFDAVTQELHPILLRSTHPVSHKIQELEVLTSKSLTINLPSAVAMARGHLEKQGEQEASACKDEFLESVNTDYPQNHDHNSQVETPKQYSKRKKLDNNRNLNLKLKEAHLKTTSSSKRELLKTLRQDQEHETLIIPSNEGLQDTIVTKVKETNEGILELAETLIYELRQTRLRRAARIMISSMQKRVSWRTTSSAEAHRVQTTFNNLKALIESAKQGEPAFAAVAANHHMTDYKQNIRTRLSRHYNGIVAESINNLADDLTANYEIAQSQNLQEQDEPDFAKTISPERVIAGATQNLKKSELKENTGSNQLSEKVLGALENVFPWVKNDKVELELVEQNGSSILFCRALTPPAKDISQTLRTQSATHKKFTAMINKIKEIELTTNSVTHPLIKAVTRMTFIGRNIRYFSSHGSNGNRVYYIVTKPTKFKKVKNLVRKHKINQDTPLVILLAETDKKHQPKTLKDFRESYRYIRK